MKPPILQGKSLLSDTDGMPREKAGSERMMNELIRIEEMEEYLCHKDVATIRPVLRI